MKKLLAAIALFVLLVIIPSISMAAGSVVATKAVEGMITTLTYAWIGDAGTGAVPASISSSVRGWIVQAVTIPGTGTAPTDLYDITLTDGATPALDLFGGALADRSQTLKQMVSPKNTAGASVIPFFKGQLTLNITNQGVHSATGTVIVTIYNEP